MAPEIRLVINPETGNVDRIQIDAPDKESQSQAFSAYQAISDEVIKFSEKTSRLIQLERVLGLIT